jgi:hypothetical protein
MWGAAIIAHSRMMDMEGMPKFLSIPVDLCRAQSNLFHPETIGVKRGMDQAICSISIFSMGKLFPEIIIIMRRVIGCQSVK